MNLTVVSRRKPLATGPVVRLALVLAVAGCASTLRTDTFHGVCATEQSDCRKACEESKNPRQQDTCLNGCDVDARACALRAGEGEEAGLGVDLREKPNMGKLKPAAPQSVTFDKGVINSSGATVSATGPVRGVDAGQELMPGASLRIGFKLPAGVRDAVLELEHGAGSTGGAAFLTVSLGEKPFLARYVVPRRAPDGKLHKERWEVGSQLPERPALDAGPTDFVLYVYNNAEAGSQGAYYLHAATLVPRTLTP